LAAALLAAKTVDDKAIGTLVDAKVADERQR
jgi:hypothetical protein